MPTPSLQPCLPFPGVDEGMWTKRGTNVDEQESITRLYFIDCMSKRSRYRLSAIPYRTNKGILLDEYWTNRNGVVEWLLIFSAMVHSLEIDC